MVEGELELQGVRCDEIPRPYSVQVHDPRYCLSWECLGHNVCPDADLAILFVEPNLCHEQGSEHHAVFDKTFEPPAHRVSPLEIGQRLTIKGFTRTEPIREYDHRAGGGLEFIRMATYGQLGFGIVESLLPRGRCESRAHPIVNMAGVSATGQLSGGPVLDEVGFIVGIISSSIQGGDLASIVDWPTIIKLGLFCVHGHGIPGIHLDGRVHKTYLALQTPDTERGLM